MARHNLFRIPNDLLTPPIYQPSKDLLCAICNRRITLETSQTDEHGRAVHEECYVLKLRLIRATEV